jgi:hypothetical protein
MCILFLLLLLPISLSLALLFPCLFSLCLSIHLSFYLFIYLSISLYLPSLLFSSFPSSLSLYTYIYISIPFAYLSSLYLSPLSLSFFLISPLSPYLYSIVFFLSSSLLFVNLSTLLAFFILNHGCLLFSLSYHWGDILPRQRRRRWRCLAQKTPTDGGPAGQIRVRSFQASEVPQV